MDSDSQKKHRDFHENCVQGYIIKLQQFSAEKHPNEIYGDFSIILERIRIGFEVYVPEEPLSVSTKRLKDVSYKTKTYGNQKVTSIGGGVSLNTLNELIEQGLKAKEHQFRKNVKNPKLLIINCHYPNSFTGLDNFDIDGQEPIDYSLFNPYPYLSGLFIDGSFEKTLILNLSARHPLSKDQKESIIGVLKT